MEQLGCPLKDFEETRYLNIFLKYFEKFKIYDNRTRATGTLREDQCTFVIIFHTFLLRMRYVSDKCCRVNQNTHFMFNKVFSKIVPFMR